jgi:hypothetical protein
MTAPMRVGKAKGLRTPRLRLPRATWLLLTKVTGTTRDPQMRCVKPATALVVVIFFAATLEHNTPRSAG